VAGEQLAGLLVEHRSPAEGEHAVVLGQRGGDGLALERAEVRLAVVDEDLGDRLAGGSGLDVVVGVAEGDAPALGQQAPTVVLPAPIGPTRTTSGSVT
jgi:hypothetical protein